MNLKQLEYFLVLSEELHFRRAASKLNITQSPLSAAIANLEAELGAKLFQRTQRQVALTEVGARLVTHARTMLRYREYCLTDMRSIISGRAGRLRIGFTAATSLLSGFPKLIQDFRVQFPDVEVNLQETPSLKQLEQLERRQIDIGLLRRPAQEIDPEISFRTILRERLVVAMPGNHPLAAKDPLSLSDLAEERFIFFPRRMGVGMYEHLTRLCSRHGFLPNIVQETEVSTTLIGLVAAGVGISIVPMGLGYIRIPNVVFRQLADDDVETELLLAFRAGEEDPKVRQLIHMVQHSFAAVSNPLDLGG